MGLPVSIVAVIRLKVDFESHAGLLKDVGHAHGVVEAQFEMLAPNANALVYAGIGFVKEHVSTLRGIQHIEAYALAHVQVFDKGNVVDQGPFKLMAVVQFHETLEGGEGAIQGLEIVHGRGEETFVSSPLVAVIDQVDVAVLQERA
jgi:hypothetical protein